MDATIQRDITNCLAICNTNAIVPFIHEHMVTKLEIADCLDMWVRLGKIGDIKTMLNIFSIYDIDPTDCVDRLLLRSATIGAYEGAKEYGHVDIMTYLTKHDYYT